ncbi:MAG TPA: hypothetical protein VFB54_13620 [Burkholderiales bacterium]|nr:hypothetical protein [Burkholderiales bacterium]
MPAASAMDKTGRLSISLSEEYNDNVRLIATKHPTVYISTLSPAAECSATTETFSALARSRIDVRRYEGDSSLNSTNVLAEGVLTKQLTRHTLGLRATFLRDPTLASELTNTGIVQENRQRTSLGLNPVWTSQLSERTSWKLSHEFADVRYQDTSGTSLTNYRAGTTRTGLEYRYTERSTAFVDAGFGYFRPERLGTRSDTRYIVIGAKHQLSERVRVQGFVGPRQVEAPSSGPSRNKSGWLANLGFERSTERGVARLSVAREVNPLGSGDITQTDKLNVSWSSKLSERLLWSVSGSFYRNQLVIGSPLRDHYYRIEGNMSWLMTKRWTIEAGIVRAHQNPDSGSSVSANQVFVGVKYDFFIPRRWE